MRKSSWILYLRDLNKESQKGVIAYISEYKPELLRNIEEGDDIEIGEIYIAKYFKPV